jgi:hypothetical protein
VNSLPPGYKVEIDQVTREDWNSVIQLFDDASIYQTWSYGALHWGEGSLSHVVLRHGPEVVAAAQCQIVRMPFLQKGGMARAYRGPMWRRSGRSPDQAILRAMTEVLHQEYVMRRGMLLRIVPNVCASKGDGIRHLLDGMDFRWKASRYRTLIVDLQPSLGDLQKQLGGDWRRNLKRALKGQLIIKEGCSDELFSQFLALYTEMMSRKSFHTGVDVHVFRKMQEDLPVTQQMKLLVAEHQGEPVCAVILSCHGDTGIYLLGATGDKGLLQGGSYLLLWRAMELMKDLGVRWFDLGGIDPEANPGTYHFKAGLGGRDVRHVGEFDTWNNSVSLVAVHVGEGLKAHVRQARHLLDSLRPRLTVVE